MSSTEGLFDTRKQLTFYGAYHNNPINILIHVICVPLLVWSFEVLTAKAPLPEVVPHIHHQFNEYLTFELNFPAIWSGIYLLYYLTLEPVAALLYAPQSIVSLLTATAFASHPGALSKAALLHGVSWIAQFLGHFLAEKRAPALLDNLIGAVVLAPFFVHLELLFQAGYRPQLHHDIKNSVGIEIARIRKVEGDSKRAKEKSL